jgi:hypothetical protein
MARKGMNTPVVSCRNSSFDQAMPNESATMKITADFFKSQTKAFENAAAAAYVDDDKAEFERAMDQLITGYTDQMAKSYSRDWNLIRPIAETFSAAAATYTRMEALRGNKVSSTQFHTLCSVRFRDKMAEKFPKLEGLYNVFGGADNDPTRFIHLCIGKLMNDRDVEASKPRTTNDQVKTLMAARIAAQQGQNAEFLQLVNVSNEALVEAILHTSHQVDLDGGDLNELADLVEEIAPTGSARPLREKGTAQRAAANSL